MTTPASPEDVLRQAINNLRAEAARLEGLLAASPDALTPVAPSGGLPVFDPESDTPPVTPSIEGDRTSLNWVSILLWGQLLTLNARHGRGADRKATVQMSKDAGYNGGRGFNGWTGRRTKDNQGNYWIDAEGVDTLHEYLGRVGYRLPDDLEDYATQLKARAS